MFGQSWSEMEIFFFPPSLPLLPSDQRKMNQFQFISFWEKEKGPFQTQV